MAIITFILEIVLVFLVFFLVVTLVGIIRPLPKMGMPTRKAAWDAAGGCTILLILVTAVLAVLPDAGPSQKQQRKRPHIELTEDGYRAHGTDTTFGEHRAQFREEDIKKFSACLSDSHELCTARAGGKARDDCRTAYLEGNSRTIYREAMRNPNAPPSTPLASWTDADAACQHLPDVDRRLYGECLKEFCD